MVASWDRDYQKGQPAATEDRVGTGKAVCYGSFFNLEATRYLLDRYAKEQEVQPLLSGAPKVVEVTRRTKGWHGLLLHPQPRERERDRLPGGGFTDLIEGTPAPARFTRKAFEYRVRKRTAGAADSIAAPTGLLRRQRARNTS